MNSLFKYINILKAFYPIQLLLIVFSPMVIACFINYELVGLNYILINLIWLSFFTIPTTLLQSKRLYRLTVLIYGVLGFIEITHWLVLKGPLTVTSILVSSNTNFQEAVDFFDLKASIWLLLLIPFVLLVIYSFLKPPQFYSSKLKLYIGGILLLIATVFILDNVIHDRFIRKSTPQLVKASLSYFDQRKLYNELKQDVAPRMISVESSMDTEEQTFVLIIGESCNRNHMSLYGAVRPTTPKLDNRDDLFIFTDVVSPYSNTISSVLTILSESNLENQISFKKSIDIFDVFSSAGFKTYWISNQSPLGIWENMVTIFAKKADHCQFSNTVGNTSREAALTASYDAKLFTPFSNALQEDGNKKLIILHLMGSHSSYEKRYPAEFDIFKGSTNKERIIAEYDNSVYYNDFIVDSLLTILDLYSSSHKNNSTSAIYLSDHGENVYDEFDNVGHDYSNELPKSNVEIPFLLWLSPTFMKLNPLKVSQIKSNVNKPFVSDDLFHSILDLNSIDCAFFEKKRSVFNAAFNTTRTRILEDGKDYDSK